MAPGTEFDPRVNKRRKTLERPLPSKEAAVKGKSKIANLDGEKDGSESERCCGICLVESGQGRSIIQGCIDSCEHFFCFLCIMEWSKVESRCPMCKRRFSAIRRLANPPVFPSERLVPVPHRDQVYDHFGNVTTCPSDLYSEAQCSVCHKSDNECLLLLCDLCDSASHTYCIGLGSIVPDGDWFCLECNNLKAEHAKAEDTTNDFDTELNLNQSSVSPDSPQVVSRERDAELLASPRTGELSAKTLWRRRNVHDRIRTLRENWGRLQCGSMSFPSGKNHDRPPHSDEIDRAWKMMGIAKSIMDKHNSKKMLNWASKHASKKTNVCRKGGARHSTYLSSHSSNCDRSRHLEKKNIFSISSSSSSCSRSLMRSAQTIYFRSGNEHCLSSSRNYEVETLKDNEVGPEKVDGSRRTRHGHEAKKEVQSLVKLNLKLLEKDRRLEVEKFEEIARLSTHSILEACGLEARQPGIPCFPTSTVCIHVMNEGRRSTLMPKSCRECFYLFVKDVVNTVMSERHRGQVIKHHL